MAIIMAFTLGFNKFLSKQFSQELTQPRDGLLASELTCKNRNNMHKHRHRLGLDQSTKMGMQEEEGVLVASYMIIQKLTTCSISIHLIVGRIDLKERNRVELKSVREREQISVLA